MKKNKVLDGNKFEESFKVSKAELRELLRKFDLKLFANRLFIEGQNVIIPPDRELNCKIKYDVDENYSVGIKITWRNEDYKVSEENEEI